MSRKKKLETGIKRNGKNKGISVWERKGNEE